MQFRLVSKPANSKGVALGFLIGPFAPLESALKSALPDWTIVTTLDKGPSLSRADLDAAFTTSGHAKNSPLVVFGWSAGCQPIRSGLVSGIFGKSLAGVGCFDGTAAAYPEPSTDQIEVWSRLMLRASRGEIDAVLTCSSMIYTELLKPPAGPFMATQHMLSRALESAFGLDPETFLADKQASFSHGKLLVRRFPSLAIDANAHVAQLREVLPALAPRLVGGFGGAGAASPSPVNQTPAEELGERSVRWCLAELDRGVKEIPAGSNRGPRIDQYFSEPSYTRHGQPLHVLGTAWCAAAQSMAHYESGGGPMFVSGLEFEAWGKAQNRIVEAPRRGDLAIFPRGAPGSWERHVTRVVEVDGHESEYGYETIGGNEGDSWKKTKHSFSEPVVFVRI